MGLAPNLKSLKACTIDQIQDALLMVVNGILPEEWFSETGVSEVQVSSIVGVLVLPHLAKEIGGAKLVKFHDLFYNAVYKYSLTNVQKLLSHSDFNQVMTFYLE